MTIVSNPILNSPFHAPARHHDFTGPAPRVIEGRRAAGYHATQRTTGTASAAPVVSHAFVPLPLVNEIRHRVDEWRARGYPNVTAVTRDLLDHWNKPERRPLFFCQREAVETVIWLTETTDADRQGIDVPPDAPRDIESLRRGYRALRRTCAKMATGSGKTTVMAMLVAWSALNKLVARQDARFSDAVLVVCPNLTVKERLAVLEPARAGNVYEAFDLVPSGYRDLLARARVHVTNWHAFAVQDDTNKRGIVQRGRESDGAFVKRVLGRVFGNAQNLMVLNDEAHHAWRPAPVADDEAEGAKADRFAGLGADERDEARELAEEATVWIGGLDRIHAVRGIKRVVDLSATPFHLKGSGHEEGSPLPWIVSDFGLVEAIESGITKVPRVPVSDDSGHTVTKYFHLWKTINEQLPASERESNKRRAKPESLWREAQGALTVLASKWEATAAHFARNGYPVPPVLIVVAANTALATVVADAVQRGEVSDGFAGGEYTFRIDSKALAQAEAAEEGGNRDDARQLMRLKTATVGRARWPDDTAPAGFEDLEHPPGRDVRCVVSVGMLTEGWDANNVTQILGLRAFSSQLLCEQVVGRGLRRMSYDVDPATGLFVPEFCDVFGIPFEVIPVQGTSLVDTPQPPPSVLVQALPERSALEIRFPRVEGFFTDVRTRIDCDVAAMQPISVTPFEEPTAVMVRAQTGWVEKRGIQNTVGDPETLTREAFYAAHRPQRIAYDIARDVTELLATGSATGRRIENARLLFPQILAVTERYLATRVVLAAGARLEEVALAKYRDVVVERLLAAIEPSEGEPRILPRIERHRPEGSTAEVQFRTTKPAKGTLRSHVSHLVLDSELWEGTAGWHLETSPVVRSYVKNQGLDFEILYEWQGGPHRYVPDFLVKLAEGDRACTLVLELKGQETEQDRSKRAAAERWVRAMNAHGGHGRWIYRVCTVPQEVPFILASALRDG